MQKYLRGIFYLFLFQALPLMANIVLDGKNQDITLQSIPYYEDKTAVLSLEEIKNKVFLKHPNTIASFGFTQSKYWFKIKTNPQKNAKYHTWWLHVSYPLLNELDLYICDENSSLIEVKKAGKSRPFDEREIKDRNFLFELNATEKQTLYLSVKSYSSMQVPMHIQTSTNLMENEQYLLVISGLYYGVFILIFFYNLISFIYTQKRSYFLYLIFISSFAIYQLSLDGLGIRFLWPSSPWIIEHGNATMMGIMILAIILFSRDFLKTKMFAPLLDKILVLLGFEMFVVMIFATFKSYGDVILYIAGTSVVLPLFLLTAAIIAYRKKLYSARFYIVGWGFFLGGSALFAMNKFAWIEGYSFLSYSQQIGSALEMIFLSWALADLQKQSEREYLKKLSGLNTFLEKKVENSLLQVRKNDQVLIEKSRLAAMGEMIEQIAHQWRQPLNTLSLINQNLYFKVQLNTADKDDCVNAHDKINEQLQYMSHTIDDFRNFSQPNKEKENFVIEEVIKSALNLNEGSLKYAKIKTLNLSNEEHICFGMRHEMMQVFMNLIKNVQDIVLENKRKEPWIKFLVKNSDTHIIIRIEDNAGGIQDKNINNIFDPYFSTKEELEGTGIGLYMSKEIIEKSMLGSISVTNSVEGAVFEILLPKVSLDK